MRLFRFFYLTVSLMLIAACSQNKSDSFEVDYLPVKLAGSELWSLIDVRTGEVVAKDEFKNQPSIARNGIFYVLGNEKKYDYFDIKSVSTPINSDSYVDVTSFNKKGIAFASKEGCPISIIDRQCRELAVLSEDIKQCFFNDILDNRYLFQSWDGKYGFINDKGEIVIPATYDIGGSFSKDGFACVGSKNDNGTTSYFVLDKTGNTVLTFSSEEYENHTWFDNGLMTVQKEGDVYLINIKGEKVLNVGKNKEYSLYNMIPNGDHIIFSDGVLFGLKNKKGEILIRAKYDDLSFVGNYLIAKKNEKSGLINTRDEVLIPFDYSDIDCLSADRYLVENEKLSAIVDVNNKDVGTNNFIAVSLVDNGLISSNFFNAIKSASYLCDSFNTEECCGYKAGTKLSDNKTWLAEVNKYVHVYGKRKSFTSMDVDDYARPIRTYHFDKFLSHEKYEYYYGYRLYDGRAATPSATLIYIEIEQSVMDYPKTAEQQFVDAMRIVLPERGFIDNGKGVFISDKGTAVTFGYNSGEIVVYYFFTSSDAISAPIVPREDKTE